MEKTGPKADESIIKLGIIQISENQVGNKRLTIIGNITLSQIFSISDLHSVS
jgi:hypothetical protein